MKTGKISGPAIVDACTCALNLQPGCATQFDAAPDHVCSWPSVTEKPQTVEEVTKNSASTRTAPLTCSSPHTPRRCGHCKRLAPTWKELADDLASTPNVKIAHGEPCPYRHAALLRILQQDHHHQLPPMLYLTRTAQQDHQHAGLQGTARAWLYMCARRYRQQTVRVRKCHSGTAAQRARS